MTENTDVLSWILWNLEAEHGSSVKVKEVYQHYMDYCSKNEIFAATSNAFGRTMYLLFSCVRNVDNHGTRTYVNVRWRSRLGNLQYEIPSHCTVKQFDRNLFIFVPTELVKNNECIQWRLQFAENKVQAFCGSTEVNLNAFGISNFAPLQGPYVSSAILAIQRVIICKGAPWDEAFGEEPQVWNKLHDENFVTKTLKSPSCSYFLNPIGKKQVCGNCTQIVYKKKLKRKRQGPVDQDENFEDAECSDSKDEPNINDFESVVKTILPDAPGGLITLMKSQLKNSSSDKDPRHRRWDPEVISMALSIWCRSPHAYTALKESGMLVLPSERLLRYYKNCVRQRPGLQIENLEWMKLEAERRELSVAGYHGGLLIDEMSVQDDLQVLQMMDAKAVQPKVKLETPSICFGSNGQFEFGMCSKTLLEPNESKEHMKTDIVYSKTPLDPNESKQHLKMDIVCSKTPLDPNESQEHLKTDIVCSKTLLEPSESKKHLNTDIVCSKTLLEPSE